MGLWHTHGSLNLGQKTRPNNNLQKIRICKIDFAVPADRRIKPKGCEKKDKYLDLPRELIKLWNMKVTIIPIVIVAFGRVTKGLLKGLEELGDEWRPSKLLHYWERPEYGEESWRLEDTIFSFNKKIRHDSPYVITNLDTVLKRI